MTLGLQEPPADAAAGTGHSSAGSIACRHRGRGNEGVSPSKTEAASVYHGEVPGKKDEMEQPRRRVVPHTENGTPSPPGQLHIASDGLTAPLECNTRRRAEDSRHQGDGDAVTLEKNGPEERKEDGDTRRGRGIAASADWGRGDDDAGWLERIEDDPLRLVLDDRDCRLRQKNALQMTVHHLDQLALFRAERPSKNDVNGPYVGSPKVKSKLFSSLLLKRDRTRCFPGVKGEREILSDPASSDEEEDDCGGVSVHQLWNLVDAEGRKLLGRLRPRIKEFYAVEVEGRRQLNASRRVSASLEQTDGKSEEAVLKPLSGGGSTGRSKLDTVHGFFRNEAESRKWRKNFLWLLPPVPEDDGEEASDDDVDEDNHVLAEDREEEGEADGSDEEGEEKDSEDARGHEEGDADHSGDKRSDIDEDGSFLDAEEGDDRQDGDTGEGSKKDDNGDDPFFSMEDMQRFVLDEEEKELAKKSPKAPNDGSTGEDGDDEDEDSVLNELLEGDEATDNGEARNVKYSDFFDAPASAEREEEESGGGRKAKRRRRRGSLSSEEQGFDGEDGPGLRAEEGELDGEERRLQKELDKLEEQLRKEDREKRRKKLREGESRKQEESDQETDAYSESSYKSDVGSDFEVEREDEDDMGKESTPSLRRLMAHSASLQSEIDQLEQELVPKKAWNLQGEVWGKERPSCDRQAHDKLKNNF